MPTISGLRRRGFPAASIRRFCDRVGVAKRNSVVELALLEHTVREDLNKSANRYMAVLNPLKVVISNYPEGQTEELYAVNNPEDDEAGTRKVPFSRVIYIEREDFREDPPKKFFRLGPGREVRLRYAYFITCTGFVKNEETGEIEELHCEYDPATRGGDSPDGRKVRGTIHWVSAEQAVNGEVRLYDRLFTKPNPGEGADSFIEHLNPNSLEVLEDCKLEPALASGLEDQHIQFERRGYFFLDKQDSTPERPVFNRTVSLRDSWARIEKRKK
jgi:glutaminyl-tRNA synthetase